MTQDPERLAEKLEISGDWLIWHDPLPINSRKADWCFVHKDFTRDNEDIRIGREESREMCLQTIDFIEDIEAQSREEATQDQVDKLIMTPLVETVARIIDPSKWAVLDSYLADMLRKYKGEHIGYDNEFFKDKASMAKAQAAIAAVFDALETPSEGMINCGAGAVINTRLRPKHGFTQHEELAIAFPAMLAKAREEMLG